MQQLLSKADVFCNECSCDSEVLLPVVPVSSVFVPLCGFSLAIGGASACRARARQLFGPLLIQSPNPRFLHGPFLVGDTDWPLSGWEYGLAPFQLGIWTGPLPVEDTHPQKPVLSCRRLHVKVLPVFANILTMLYFNHCPHPRSL